VTPARWDRYVAGDDGALTNDERAGLAKFLDAGCTTCHNGVDLGGQMYMKLGAVRPWPTAIADNGRFDVTKNEADRHVFKVPSLRNIEKTAPYFHDGSMATLEETVRAMGAYQLGKDLSTEEVASIVTFLKSLTGTLPQIEKPVLPKGA
jgi:cytochrome c peroxidase